nr:spore coat protein [uncultured Tyzzerella sp.]
MNEKDMVLDILTGLKANIVNYAKIITECNDLNLRQIFQQMRNEAEEAQYNLYKFAEKKGYYIPSPKDTAYEIQTLKTKLTQALTAKNGAGPMPAIK